MASGKVRFDMFAWQVVPWPIMRDDVRYLETLDIGTVWVGDEYAHSPPWACPILEPWTTLGALASCTSRVRLGTLVSDPALRHPAILAKQAATVDCLSAGRLDLGIGVGDSDTEQTAWLGLPSLTPSGRVDRFSEAVEIVDRLLRDQKLTYHGKYYSLDEAPLTPAPVQRPRPPLIIATEGKRALRVVAERADVWATASWGNTSQEALQHFRERNRLVDEHCTSIGRDSRKVERACIIGWEIPAPFVSAGAFQEIVGQYRDAGVQRFIFCFGSASVPPPYDARVAEGAWASRAVLDAFAAQAMADLQGS